MYTFCKRSPNCEFAAWKKNLLRYALKAPGNYMSALNANIILYISSRYFREFMFLSCGVGSGRGWRKVQI